MKFKNIFKAVKLYEYITKLHTNNSKKEFVQYKSYQKPINNTNLIAFYLPQFHQIEENNLWHGRGFTEWTNVAKAIPHFEGHIQPHIPYDVGFYDLSHDNIMYRQVELAKNYGIAGFCFHYYWFSGKRLLERPIFNWLNNKELDLPFCLCWANENWSKLWDGGNKEVLMKQEIKVGDKEKFLDDILPFFQDKRYIKINNKPLLIIYKIECVEENALKDLISYLKNEIKNHGFDGLYLLTTNSFIYDKALKQKAISLGFDEIMEFPPHGITHISKKNTSPNKYFHGNIIDMKKVIEEKLYFTNAKYKCVFPSWDNSARKAETGCLVMQTSREDYKKWLRDCILESQKNGEKHPFVFVNTWNEWAEGSHLEPDIKMGYAHLQDTREVLEEFEDV